jgi:hypothetical protein
MIESASAADANRRAPFGQGLDEVRFLFRP